MAIPKGSVKARTLQIQFPADHVPHKNFASLPVKQIVLVSMLKPVLAQTA